MVVRIWLGHVLWSTWHLPELLKPIAIVISFQWTKEPERLAGSLINPPFYPFFQWAGPEMDCALGYVLDKDNNNNSKDLNDT